MDTKIANTEKKDINYKKIDYIILITAVMWIVLFWLFRLGDYVYKFISLILGNNASILFILTLWFIGISFFSGCYIGLYPVLLVISKEDKFRVIGKIIASIIVSILLLIIFSSI